MLFPSMTFLFLFFPIVLAAYYVLPWRPWRNGVLILSSLVFYSWGEPRYLLLFLLTALFTWIMGILICHCVNNRLSSRLLLCTSITLLLSVLIYFKGLELWPEAVAGNFAALGMPLGISFYTFQCVSYLVDVNREECKAQRNPLIFLLYISLFPQLIAGPIVRYHSVESQLRERNESISQVISGLRRFIFGLGKKVLLAGQMALIADTVYSVDHPGTLALWIAALAFVLEIYYDFSGYSDMAIGLGRMFGFTFPENFDAPYCSLSVTEYARKWHMSLASFFRDYVYIPLGGNRVGKVRLVCNLLTVWLITGLWHGMRINFLLWGGTLGIMIVIEKLGFSKVLERLPKFLRHLYFWIIILFVMTCFRVTDSRQLLSALSGMIGFGSQGNIMEVFSQQAESLAALAVLPIAFLLTLPFMQKLKIKMQNLWVTELLLLLVFLLSIASIITDHYDPFIYFRF